MQAKQAPSFASGFHQVNRSMQPAPTRVSARLDARRGMAGPIEHRDSLYGVPRIPQAGRKRKRTDSNRPTKKAQIIKAETASDAGDVDMYMAVDLTPILQTPANVFEASPIQQQFPFLQLPAQVIAQIVSNIEPTALPHLMTVSKQCLLEVIKTRKVKIVTTQATGFDGFKQLMSWVPSVSVELRQTGKLRKGPKPTLYRVLLGYDHMPCQERRVRKGSDRKPHVRILDPWVGCYFPGIREISIMDTPTLLGTLSFWRSSCPAFDTLNVGYALTLNNFQHVLQHPNILNLKLTGLQYIEDLSGMKCHLERLSLNLQGLDFQILPRLPILNLQQPLVLFSTTGMLIKETGTAADHGYMTWQQLEPLM